jgi:hypothetical protein
MVTILVVVHPSAMVKVIIAVPAITPVIIPVEPAVAVPIALLVQVPGPEPSERAVLKPVQILEIPVMGRGMGLTVRTAVA